MLIPVLTVECATSDSMTPGSRAVAKITSTSISRIPHITYGAVLSRRIEEFVQPSDIFSFETSPFNGTVEPEGPLVHTLNPITPPQRFTPSDHRALSLLFYFHAVSPDPIQPTPLGQTTASRWNTNPPFCAHPPYEVTSSVALDLIVLTGAGAKDAVRTGLGRVCSLRSSLPNRL
jgi:hypothetical protein